nr:uncharacterized protein LOC111417212 [Onthophagus taurus]XP_022911514.1 uncharacterized protein LOC111422545 [Onthophagus taurus]
MYMENDENEKLDVSQDSQNFYPSFAQYNDQPLGHSRPFYYQPETAYSHRPTAYQQHVGFESARISGYKGDYYEDRSPNENSILGSGNFGVIKGGTFYNDKDSEEFDYDGGYSFYHNGHGRPSFYNNNKRPSQHEQFENFRDFADINTPSYSHFVVVYANKNGTKSKLAEEKLEITQEKKKPKNILEHLALIDLEATERSVTKKLSKSKVKLSKFLIGKKQKQPKNNQRKVVTTRTDLFEPLLALS